MDRQIVLSKIAERKLEKLFNYLELKWSKNVKLAFIAKLEEKLTIIRSTPEAFPKSSIKQGLYKCVITKQNSLYYTFDDRTIYILTVFDTRQDPGKLEKEI